MSILILIISYKILKKYLLKKFEDQKEENIYDYYLNFFLTINFIIIVVLIFPTHSFIRYYFFIYPFVFSIIFIEFGMKKTLLISIIACLLISIETILFRLLYFV